MRGLAYVLLVALYFVLGTMGGTGSGWPSTLALNMSAGCATGFLLLFIEYEVFRY